MSRNFIKTTEKNSLYNNLELKSTREILLDINQEDKAVAYIVEKIIPKIEILIDSVYKKLKNGGRLFYIGSGTSGRLGILDASECPPTFGVDSELVIGIIAGGDKAIRKSQEYAEDSLTQAWKDLKKYKSLPIYKFISSTGPKHKPLFKIAVKIHNSEFINATGYSKKDAELKAANLFLKKIGL